MKSSEDNKKRAWDLVKKASNILKPLKDEPVEADGLIRRKLIDGLDCIEEYLRIANGHKEEFEFSLISTNVMSLSFFLRNAGSAEFQYAVNRLTKWMKAGYEDCNNALARLLTSELSKESSDRRLGLTDREYVDIIIGCNATVGSGLSGMLHNPAVLEYYIRKASEGDFRHAFALGAYYYESEEYGTAFNTLKDLKDDHTAKYLGLMYYYGRGTSRNQELARDFLEQYYYNYICTDNEVIWALGESYGRYESKRKQFEFYIEHLENPYRYDDDAFIKRMLKQCVRYKRNNSTGDWIPMTVEIKPDGLECEFSLELAPYCHITVVWGDGTCDRYGDLDKTGTVSCRHIYTQSGTYIITIESLWEKIVEGFNFSRNKRQLRRIYLGDCPGLKKLSVIGQCLTSLEPASGKYRKDFLIGMICRDNELTELDLSGYPNLTYLDCSFNPITVLKLTKCRALSVISLPESVVNKPQIDELLRLNRGSYCSQINYDDLPPIMDMRLEHYFRCAKWDKVKKYLRENEQYDYDHQLAKCELTFTKLKEMSTVVNHNPYEDKGGFLAVNGSYISDDTILHHEEFFITAEAWSTCLGTKVRDIRRREPWMGFPSTPPEYYVASCLVNMIKPWREIKNYPILQNETEFD